MHEIRGTNFWDTLYALVHPLIFSESHGTYKQERVEKAEVVYVSILNQSCLSNTDRCFVALFCLII